MKDGLSIGKGILWVLIWFGFMLLYTALDIKVWRKVTPAYGKYLNLLFIVLSIIVFLRLLTRVNQFKLNLSENISLQGILLAIICAALFYFALDKGLDPIFVQERLGVLAARRASCIA